MTYTIAQHEQWIEIWQRRLGKGEPGAAEAIEQHRKAIEGRRKKNKYRAQLKKATRAQRARLIRSSADAKRRVALEVKIERKLKTLEYYDQMRNKNRTYFDEMTWKCELDIQVMRSQLARLTG